MGMQTLPDENTPSDELSRVMQELAYARGEQQRHRQKLTALHRLIHALACLPDEEGIIKALTKELPSLVDAVLVGIARSNRNQVWIWSDSRNREWETRVRRYLLRRLDQFPSRRTDRGSPQGRSRHLYLVPPTASRSLTEQDSAFGHEVPLVLGQEETGLLLIQPKDQDRLAQLEREALETVGASLSLALRHAETHQRVRSMAPTHTEPQCTGIRHRVGAAVERRTSIRYIDLSVAAGLGFLQDRKRASRPHGRGSRAQGGGRPDTGDGARERYHRTIRRQYLRGRAAPYGSAAGSGTCGKAAKSHRTTSLFHRAGGSPYYGQYRLGLGPRCLRGLHRGMDDDRRRRPE